MENLKLREPTIVIFVLFAGSLMQCYANKTLDAVVVSLFFLMFAYAFLKIVFPKSIHEHRAFVWSFSACVFVGGLAQLYSTLTFGIPQSTNDAIGFFEAIFGKPPFYTWEECKFLWIKGAPVSRGSPLPVFVWQRVYQLLSYLDIDYGIHIAVIFNAFITALSGSLTVHIARIVFGGDIQKLKRVIYIYTFCGLFLLYGSIMIRDSFALFVNVLVLWGIIKWLYQPTINNLLFAILLTGISSSAMVFIRFKTIVIFALIFLLGIIFWFFAEKLNRTRFISIILFGILILSASPFIIKYFEITSSIQSERTEAYLDKLNDTQPDESMAMRLIVAQPMPIRLALGSFVRLIFPLPIWAHLKLGENEYHIIMNYNGIYQLVVFPFFILGCIISFRNYTKNKKKYAPHMFLLIYLLMNYEAILATSFEQRHLGQFMPAFCILAAIPDINNDKNKRHLKIISKYWAGIVIFVHLVYILAKEIL